MDVPIDILVHGRSDTTEAFREYAIRRLSFALRRFTHRVRHVEVRAVDENGPRRGVDSRCSIATRLIDGGQIFVEATAAKPFSALTLAARRLSQALRREGRRRTVWRAAAASRRGRLGT
jgi:ribosome-associated translation inhibitor RaiA